MEPVAIEVDGQLIVGGYEGLLVFDGAEWSQIDYTPDQGASMVWAAARDDIYTVGGQSVWHNDGETIEQVFSVDGVGENGAFIHALWGAASDDVWVGGHTQNFDTNPLDLYHYDGSDWTRADFDADGTVQTIWGASSDDVYAGTSIGILHWDGASWTLVDDHLVYTNSRFWGTGSDDVWLAGMGDFALHFDGNAWTEVQTPGSIRSIWGTQGDDLYASGWDDVDGEAMWHWDGATFEPVPMPALSHAASVTGYDGDPVLLSRETIVRFVAGEPQHWLDTVQSDDIRDVWIGGPSEILATDGRLLAYRGEQWEPLTTVEEEQFDGVISRVTARSMSDAFLMGLSFDLGLPRVFHYDGKTLTPVDVPGQTDFQPAAGYTDTAGTVWIVGQNQGWEELPGNDPDFAARVIRSVEGTSFEDVSPAGYDVALAGVGGADGHVFTFGWSGTVLHFDGDQWSRIDPGFDDVQQMFVAGPQDVYVVRFAGSGEIHHWDGEEWTQPPALEGFRWRQVGGSAPDDVLALAQAEEDGVVALAAHFDGQTWNFVDELPTGLELGDLYGARDGTMLLSRRDIKWLRDCQ